MTALDKAIEAIDVVNAADPNWSEGVPAALLYGQRMSAELQRLYPGASDALKAAARGQHIERWVLKRTDYPEGRAGYLAWRTDLAKHHAGRVGSIMAEAGFDADAIAAAGQMLRKEGIKRQTDVQALEDVICFVFLKWYLADFATKQPPDKLLRIVQKTARKMSANARGRALKEFDLPVEFAEAFTA